MNEKDNLTSGYLAFFGVEFESSGMNPFEYLVQALDETGRHEQKIGDRLSRVSTFHKPVHARYFH